MAALGLVAAVCGLGIAAAPAGAAKPIKGAYYAGFDGRLRYFNFPNDFRDVSAELRVSRSGRRITGRGYGSYVSVAFECKRDKEGYFEGTIRMASPRLRGPRIRRDGSFRLVKRTGRLRYRLRGRFVSPDAAKLVYRASMPPREPKNPSNPGRCTVRRRPVALRRDAEAPFRGCRYQRARTLIWGSIGRVFTQYRLTFQGFMPYVFGCLFGTNRRFALSQDHDDEAVDEARLSGAFVALGQSFCPLGCGFGVEVTDLRNGREIRTASSPGAVADLELKGNGSAAWISYPSFYPSKLVGQTVWADDNAGHARLLDSGKISKRSLTLTGSTLTWLKDGVVRSATLY